MLANRPLCLPVGKSSPDEMGDGLGEGASANSLNGVTQPPVLSTGNRSGDSCYPSALLFHLSMQFPCTWYSARPFNRKAKPATPILLQRLVRRLFVCCAKRIAVCLRAYVRRRLLRGAIGRASGYIVLQRGGQGQRNLLWNSKWRCPKIIQPSKSYP